MAIPRSPFSPDFIESNKASARVNPSLSFADGAAVCVATAGCSASFVVHSVDSFGFLYSLGGQLFEAVLTHSTTNARHAFLSLDSGDGAYSISYSLTRSGVYLMVVTAPGIESLGGNAISGSPFAVTVLPGAAGVGSVASGGGLVLP